MLIEFSVGNYRSFKDEVTLSMVAANLTSKNKELDTSNVIAVDQKLSLLTSAAIYGANASGKSNLIAAIRFMRTFVLSSSRETQITDTIAAEPFRLSTATEHEPATFEMVFLLQGTKYRYGFATTTKRVVDEWLYYVPTTREALLFERKLDTIEVKGNFKEGRGLEERTRPNALFLSVVAQFNGQVATQILRWFQRLNVSFGISETHDMLNALTRFENETLRPNIVSFVQQLDLGISDIHIQRSTMKPPKLPHDAPEDIRLFFDNLEKAEAEQISILTRHRKYNENNEPVEWIDFELDEDESEGTQKIFALAYPIIHTLRYGTILVIDEIDARLHPLITCEIIKLFNSVATNPHKAQLIFTTHDTNLLSTDMLRRDQIWFTEKTRQGASQLYSLAEYKYNVRNDAAFEKNYIEGRYGAIPFIGDFSHLLSEAANNG